MGVPSIELEIEDISSVRTKKDGEALLKKLTNKLNRTPSRLSMSRTPSKHRLPRTSSSSHTPMSPLTPISRNNSKGSVSLIRPISADGEPSEAYVIKHRLV